MRKEEEEEVKVVMHRVPQKIKDFAGLISAVLVISGALVGAGHWIVKEVSASTNERIDALESKIDSNQDENKRAVTRLELLTLIDTTPENTAEIERVARYYFQTLKGDWYLTSLYSTWCREYGGDASIVVK